MHYEKFADGTIKCIEEQVLLDVPDTWAWTKINTIAFVTKLAGFEYTTYIAPNLCNNGIPLFKGKNIQDSQIIYKFESYIPEDISDELSRSQINRKCILTPYVGTIGNIGIHNQSGKFHLGSNVGKIELCNNNVVLMEEYVVAYLQSSFGYGQLTKHMKATAQASISIEAIRDVYIPIPPGNEQKRLCNEIQKVFLNIDKIIEEQNRITELITTTKSKILDLAIRIKAEKEELIKQGKIKRDKAESTIFKGVDNSYYRKIPNNWEITTLRDITSPLTLNDGDWILSENMSSNGEIKLLQLGSIGNMTYIDKGFKFLTRKTFNDLSCTEIFSGYLLINRIISDKMCCCIIPNISGPVITTVDTCWIAPVDCSYNIKFLMYQLSSSSFQSMVQVKATGTTRKRISKNNLIDLPILFPPLAEQQRVVDAIETAFTELDKILADIA